MDALDPPATWFRRWTAALALAMTVLTVRLWLPQTIFPRVPLIESAVGWADGVDLLALGAMLCGLLLTITPQRERFGWLVFAVAYGVAVLADQHRLQPWAYQFGLLAVVFATAGERRQRPLARWMVVGILFHSACSKLDAGFLQEQGRDLLELFASSVGLRTKWWSEPTRHVLTGALSVAELGIAIGLVVPRTRRWSAWLAIGMHALLLTVLGVAGHSWGVLLWNVFAIGEVLLLFEPWNRSADRDLATFRPHDAAAAAAPEPTAEPAAGNTTRTSPRTSFLLLGEVAVAVACLAPFLEWVGRFDHWPSWAVYSARTERVVLLVPADFVEDLPESARPFVSAPHWDGLCRVRLDNWSMQTLGVPLYPQERFRIGVARAAISGLPAEAEPVVEILGLPSRWSGERSTERLVGREAIEDRAFVWNAIPKPL